MKNEKTAKMKKWWLIVLYVLIAAVLFTGIGLARYTDSFVAYPNFGAASFNTVILDKDKEVITEDMLVENCMPGMNLTEDTAKIVPFCVANGMTAEDVSEVGVSYTLRLRSTRNMPLKFILYSMDEDGTNRVKKYEADEPVLVEQDEKSYEQNVWYEWTFMDTSGKEPTEAIFSFKAAELDFSQYQLVIEWPVEEGEKARKDNAVDYMKEVDLIEILATVSSKNNTEKTEITHTIGDLYGKGMILIDPTVEPGGGDEKYPYQYSSTVDLRAFYAPEESDEYRIYDFLLDNGVKIGLSQVCDYTDYCLELKVPYTVEDDMPLSQRLPDEAPAYATKDFQYELLALDEDGTYKPVGSPKKTELRLYTIDVIDENYGTYEVVSESSYEPTEWAKNLEEWTKEKSGVRLYKVYTYEGTTEAPFRLYNRAINSIGEYADHAFAADYRIRLTGYDDPDQINDITAFENKIEILVKTAQVNEKPKEPDPVDEEGGDNS